MSAFCFIDRVSELKPNESVTAIFYLKGDEEFLLDHFEGFPVMPGVLQLEMLKQAAFKLLESPGEPKKNYAMTAAQGIKFGQFIRPKDTLKATVRLIKNQNHQSSFEGRLDLIDSVSGDFKGKAVSALFELAVI